MTDQKARAVETGEIVPLTEVLLTHAKGSIDAEAGEKLRELAAAVAETGKKGSVSVVLAVAPVPRSDGMVALTATVTAKIPDHDPATSVWFTDETGVLSRQHPSQMSAFPDLPPRD
jgi:hypothetical protein